MIISWALFKLYNCLENDKGQMDQDDSTAASTPHLGPAKTVTTSSIAITEDSTKRDIIHASTDDSLRSKNSFGFVPSIRSVAPLSNRGKRGTQNFLMLLDSLDALEDEEAKRSRRKRVTTAASASGIEANSSDETASQTRIGKELEVGTDPGRITLNFIKVQDDGY